MRNLAIRSGAIVGALMLLLPGVAAAAPGDPADFARELYALPNLWADVTADEASEAKYLTPHLAELVAANAELDEVDQLDYDPLVDSQDFQITDVQVTVTKADDQKAAVRVEFQNLGDDQTMTLDLEVVDDAWHLANIHYDDERSLTDDLDFIDESE